nr:Hypothetical protein SC2p1_01920 [Methylocystis sp. SC2]
MTPKPAPFKWADYEKPGAYWVTTATPRKQSTRLWALRIRSVRKEEETKPCRRGMLLLRAIEEWATLRFVRDAGGGRLSKHWSILCMVLR